MNDPVYIETYQSGALKEKVKQAWAVMNDCVLCPRKCRARRMAGEAGICNTGQKAVVYNYHEHFGEEVPLVGEYGSGTIFFTFCNLMCNFCQNYEISHGGEGREVTPDQIAYMMVQLQKQGCHNINLVSPTHVVPQILSGLDIAIQQGLKIPIVYNTGGYDAEDTLAMLDGVVDIYMPDIKFLNSQIAEQTCQAGDYPDIVKKAVKEMYRQVGDLEIDKEGIAMRGLLVRHLVLPDNLANTSEVMRFLVNEISGNTYVNIMSQYRPCGKAHEVKGLERRITDDEYESAILAAVKEGIVRLDSVRPRMANLSNFFVGLKI